MKFALALLLALVATASARVQVHAPNGDLDKEIQDFLKLIPFDKIVEVTLRYMADDPEFQEFVEFLQSDKFKKLVDKVERLEGVHKLMDYMYNAGFDIYYYINQMNQWLGLPPLIPPNNIVVGNYKTDGMRGYLDEIEALLPVDKLKALYDKKMKESKVWKDFISQLQSDEFQEIVNEVYVDPTVQEMIEMAKRYHVDLELVVRLLKEMLGIDIPDRP